MSYLSCSVLGCAANVTDGKLAREKLPESWFGSLSSLVISAHLVRLFKFLGLHRGIHFS